MRYLVTPSYNPTGTVSLPASKSISNRALILNALSYSPYDIENLSECDDTRVMCEAFASNSNHFDILAAGTAMRFLTAFLSKIVGEWSITGSERMKQRPIGILVEALRSVGARIEYIEKEGYPPLRIFGSSLQGGELTLKGNVSSQYISALLMVAPYMEQGLTLQLEGEVISKPYIHMTLALMKQFGVTAVWSGQTIRVERSEYTPIPFSVESDWSAASYWYEIAALSPHATIKLKGLQQESVQGDARIAQLFDQLGVETRYLADGVELHKTNKRCEKLECDLTDQPDLAQTLVVTAAMLEIPFRITGLQSLKIKETDRIAALQTELHKLGYVIDDIDNSILAWEGERCPTHYESEGIDTYDDHRMAMAFAPTAYKHPTVVINEPMVVTKSYPTFWSDLAEMGFTITTK